MCHGGQLTSKAISIARNCLNTKLKLSTLAADIKFLIELEVASGQLPGLGDLSFPGHQCLTVEAS